MAASGEQSAVLQILAHGFSLHQTAENAGNFTAQLERGLVVRDGRLWGLPSILTASLLGPYCLMFPSSVGINRVESPQIAKPWRAFEKRLISPRKRHSKESTHTIFPALGLCFIYVFFLLIWKEILKVVSLLRRKEKVFFFSFRNMYVREKACSKHLRWTRKTWREDGGSAEGLG